MFNGLSSNNFETKYKHISIKARLFLISDLLVKTLVIVSHKDFMYLMGQLPKLDKEHLGDCELVKKNSRHITRQELLI